MRVRYLRKHRSYVEELGSVITSSRSISEIWDMKILFLWIRTCRMTLSFLPTNSHRPYQVVLEKFRTMITWHTAVLFHRSPGWHGSCRHRYEFWQWADCCADRLGRGGKMGRWVEKSHQSCMWDVGISPQQVRLPDPTWRGSGDHDVSFWKIKMSWAGNDNTPRKLRWKLKMTTGKAM